MIFVENEIDDVEIFPIFYTDENLYNKTLQYILDAMIKMENNPQKKCSCKNNCAYNTTCECKTF